MQGQAEGGGQAGSVVRCPQRLGTHKGCMPTKACSAAVPQLQGEALLGEGSGAVGSSISEFGALGAASASPSSFCCTGTSPALLSSALPRAPLLLHLTGTEIQGQGTGRTSLLHKGIS